MEIIILTVIILVLAVILFFALRKLIASITMDSKDYYMKRMQDYDEEILSKAKELELMGKNDPVVVQKDKEEVSSNQTIDKDLLKIMSNTEYSGENIMKLANKVDEIFNVAEEKIIKDFVHNIEINEDYKIYQSLYDRFSPNLIYRLKMLNKETQIKEIGKMIPDEEYEVFDSYIKSHKKFKLDKFLLDLSLLIERSRPNIEILVGNKNKNYDNLNPYIKTIYDEDIYKGIIIKYQDRIYDYSINERDV
jgi:hypothetical protein